MRITRLLIVPLLCALSGAGTSTLTLGCGTVSGSHSSGGKVGVAYKTSLAATGGLPAYYFEITSGGLPSGLMFDASTGTIFGNPGQNGTFPIGAAVTDITGARATAACTIYIAQTTKKR
jgi:large repetitive protein